MKKLSALALLLILCAAWTPVVYAQTGKSEGTALVGRITFIDGQLLRYVYDEKDWVATVKDAPFGLEDALYSSDTGKAELKLPNGVWVRTGSDTQIQLIVSREDLVELDVASGVARLYNKSQKTLIKATTPFGYVLARPGTAVDLYVGDSSAEIISLNGSIDFIIGENEARYSVEAGGASIISDGKVVVDGDGKVDASWDDWNLKREELWTQRVEVKGDSIDNLPTDLRDDAYDLDRNGKWERVYYAGRYWKMWRPTNVSPGWQPFTTGRWTVWFGDNVWIPGESFGYVTHHYGNWVFVNSTWYWAPPLKVGIARMDKCACWYPGRVYWVHSDKHVGWFPLAPGETYYSHNYWGPGSLVVRADRGTAERGIHKMAYAGQAVVVPESSLYNVNSYAGVRIANVNRGHIVSRYKVSPVITDRVLPNYSSNQYRYVYNIDMAHLTAKPHHAVVARIDRNLTMVPGARRSVSAVAIQRELARIGRGKTVSQPPGQHMRSIRVTSRIVPENMVHRPRSEVQFVQRPIKTQAIRPSVRPGGGSGVRPYEVRPRGAKRED